MDNKDERNLTVIESVQTEKEAETVEKTSRQTNPITKKFVEFHLDKTEKFGVKDLFKR